MVRGSREACEINSIRRHYPATQAGCPSLYSHPRWQSLFPDQYPAVEALRAANMMRFFKVSKSWPAIFSCGMLIIEVLASKCHVLEEQTMRIGEGVVLAGAYSAKRRSPCSRTRAFRDLIGGGLCKRRYLCMPCTNRVSELPSTPRHQQSST